MRFGRHAIQALAILWVMLIIVGCATSRGTLDIRPPTGVNPQGDHVVRVVDVIDLRQFELKPRQSSIPSLKDGQIDNKDITLRAIARKRNAYGAALGDILLPEGRTVESLVRESIKKALLDKGYQVVEKEENQALNASPLSADIHKFWAWFTPGFWAAKLEFESEIKLKSPVLMSGNSEIARGYIMLRTQAGTGRAWMNTIDKGLINLIEDMKQKIKSP